MPVYPGEMCVEKCSVFVFSLVYKSPLNIPASKKGVVV